MVLKQRICIYGTGAIGGLLAARLSETTAEVSCICRGQQLKSILSNGLLLIDNNEEYISKPRATDDPSTLGIQDIVFITLKAHALPENAAGIAQLTGPHTTLVTAHNGLPWWYFYRDTSTFPQQHLGTVDPDGVLWNQLGPERTIGAIVYPAAVVTRPGVIQHISGNRFTVGEPDGKTTRRLERLSELLRHAGFEITPTANIRSEIWLKLAVNAAINPLSLQQQTTVEEILHDPVQRRRLTDMIIEAQQVAKAIGIEPLMPAKDLVNLLDIVKTHKTSMLVDFESNRPVELDALTGAVIELGGLLDVATPQLTELYFQTQQMLANSGD